MMVVVRLSFYHRRTRKGEVGYYWIAEKDGKLYRLHEIGDLLNVEKIRGKTRWAETWVLPDDVKLYRVHYGAHILEGLRYVPVDFEECTNPRVDFCKIIYRKEVID